MKFAKYLLGAVAALAVLTLFLIDPALAQEAAAEATEPAKPAFDTGDTAWMLTSTALVLMMTIPGLALFYGGMVRKKNILTIVMQCFATTCIITVVWMVIGYSLAFTDGGGMQKYLGGMSQFMLKAMTLDSAHSLAGTIPELVFMTFQMTFAIITPALIVGAFADRMKFSALVLFMILWSIVVYAPIAHWVWGGGFLGGAGVLDYAGGTVVHINAGIAGLVTAIYLGKRTGYGTENMAPSNLVLQPDRRRPSVGRLVRLQRRFRSGGRHARRHGHGCHADRHGDCGTGLDVGRMARAQEAERARHHLGRGRRSRRHHAGIGLRRSGGGAVDRRGRGRRLLLRGNHGQAGDRL